MKIRKGDTIKIITGKDKGKTGKILKSFPKKDKVLIEGLNLYKKHVKPKRQGESGQIVAIPRPIDVSNIMIMCSNCGKAVRVGFKMDGENKTRYCKSCQSAI